MWGAHPKKTGIDYPANALSVSTIHIESIQNILRKGHSSEALKASLEEAGAEVELK